MDVDPAHLFNQAQDALEAGEVDRARRHLHAVMVRDPGDSEALLVLARLERDEGRDARAAELLAGHLEQARDSQPVLVELGDVRLALGDPAGAAEALKLALTLRPHHWESLLLLGNCFVDVGAFPEAVRAYELGLGSNPFSADLWYNLACARTEAGDTAGAREAWRAWLGCADADAPERTEIEARLAVGEG